MSRPPQNPPNQNLANTSILIECSNNTANSILSNGEFECAPAIPITINNGDALDVKLSILDNKRQDSGQIFLENAIQISASFVYYDENFSSYGKQYFIQQSSSNLGPNVMYGPVTFDGDHNAFMQPIVGNISFYIRAGSYSPDFLAIMLTNGFNEINNNQSNGNTTQQLIYVGPPAPEGGYFMGGPIFLQTNTNNPPFYDGGQPDGSNGVPNYYQYNSANNAYYIGTNQVIIGYNNNNSNRFEFTYLHSPLFDSDSNQVTVLYESDYPIDEPATLNRVTKFASRRGGIILTDLQPADFWTSLGFDLPSIVQQMQTRTHTMLDGHTQSTTSFINLAAVDTFTTDGYINNDDTLMFKNTDNNSIRGFVLNNIASNIAYPLVKSILLTRPIYASSSFFFNNVSNYYLLEISNMFNEFHSTNNISHTISSVISKNYSAENYIISYQWDSIPYIHRGDSVLLSSIKIRILDPKTKQPATDIGPNNSIFLQLIRG